MSLEVGGRVVGAGRVVELASRQNRSHAVASRRLAFRWRLRFPIVHSHADTALPARVRLRILARRLLRRYGYPFDRQERTIRVALEKRSL